MRPQIPLAALLVLVALPVHAGRDVVVGGSLTNTVRIGCSRDVALGPKSEACSEIGVVGGEGGCRPRAVAQACEAAKPSPSSPPGSARDGEGQGFTRTPPAASP